MLALAAIAAAFAVSHVAPQPALAYVGDKGIYVAAANGTNRRLLPGTAGALDVFWSPDGTTLAFTHEPTKSNSQADNIWTVAADGTHLRRLTHDGLSSVSHWSPDGKQIFCFHDGDWCVVDATTGAEAPADPTEAQPTPSPDGSSGAYEAPDQRLLDQIWVDNRPITKTRGSYVQLSDPAWSPDSQWLAFCKSTLTTDQIDLMHPDGTALHRLTRGCDPISAPSWSPDGSMIAFARAVNSNDYGVFAIKPDGTGLRRLTGAGGYFNPTWRPQRH